MIRHEILAALELVEREGAPLQPHELVMNADDAIALGASPESCGPCPFDDCPIQSERHFHFRGRP